MRKFSAFIALVILLGTWLSDSAMAGEKFLTAKRASLWFGTRELFIENTHLTTQLDFLDYANNYQMGEYFMLGFSIQLEGRGPSIINFDVFTSDDIIPTSFYLDYQYNILPWFGLNLGFMQYPFLITGYDEFYKNTDLDFFTDGGPNANSRQSRHNDFALTFGPSITLEGNAGFIYLLINGAYSNLIPFVESFRQKKSTQTFAVKSFTKPGLLHLSSFFHPSGLGKILQVFRVNDWA
jgi:hypothetical protein